MGLDEGLAGTIAWYLENAAWCEAVQSGAYRRERLGTA
jgi:dTDP-glucose 4,6-dehydratase